MERGRSWRALVLKFSSTILLLAGYIELESKETRAKSPLQLRNSSSSSSSINQSITPSTPPIEQAHQHHFPPSFSAGFSATSFDGVAPSPLSTSPCMTSGLPRAVRLPVKSAMMLLVVCAMVLRLSKSGRKTTMAVLKKSQMMPTTIQPVRVVLDGL